jgi:two-component system cell cycle sensor histidine kinase/response regulator CckA
VESAPGQGTRFSIYLPESAEGHVERAPQQRAAPDAPAATRGPAAGRILLVEDDDLIRRMLVGALGAAGYEVVQARSGDEALELWELGRGSFDVVVSDVVMPGISGLELTERLAREQVGMPIVLMSGLADQEGDPARLPPAATFLHKPFTPDDLLHAVGEAVSRASGARAARAS